MLYAINFQDKFGIDGQVATVDWLNCESPIVPFMWTYRIMFLSICSFHIAHKGTSKYTTHLGNSWRLSIEKVLSLSEALRLTSSCHLKGLFTERGKENRKKKYWLKYAIVSLKTTQNILCITFSEEESWVITTAPCPRTSSELKRIFLHL